MASLSSSKIKNRIITKMEIRLVLTYMKFALVIIGTAKELTDSISDTAPRGKQHEI